jgi:hypothetical protein
MRIFCRVVRSRGQVGNQGRKPALRTLAVIAQAKVRVDLKQALVDEEMFGEAAGQRAAEEPCGDNLQ